MKKVVCFFLKFDYGLPARGESLEKKYFWPGIRRYFVNSTVIWLEDIGFLEKDYPRIQIEVIRTVENEHPDIVFFILMRDEITLQTIQYISSRCTTVNWFSDDHWRFHNWSTHLANVLTYAITVDKYSLENYRKVNKAKPILSQWGSFELPPIDENVIGKEFLSEISFVGTKNLIREWYITVLEKNGLKVDCYGSGWDNGRLNDEEMMKIFLKSRINLNLSNSVPKDIRFLYFLVNRIFYSILRLDLKKIKYYKKGLSQFFNKNTKSNEQMKARNFEIPSAGGFQLSHYTLELEDYFVIGKEVAIYTTCDELVKQVNFYLQHPDSTQIIRLEGFQKSRRQSFQQRIHDFCDAINNQML